MTSSPTLDRMRELAAQMEAIRAEMKGESQNVMTEGVKELFEKYPKLDRFGFKITGPHAMDGDPTDASVRRDDVDDLGIVYDGHTFSGEDEIEDENNDWEMLKMHPGVSELGYGWDKKTKRAYWDKPVGVEILSHTQEKVYSGKVRDEYTYANPEYNTEFGPVVSDIAEFLGVFPIDILRDVYEDNVQVTFIRDGDKVKVEKSEYGYW